MRAKSELGNGSHGTVGGRARRDQIERAAAEVLADMGYAATSVGRIAEHAGVSKGVITYHFTSKDKLLHGMALRLFQECIAHIDARTSAAITPAERLRAELSAELDFFSSRRVEFRAMMEVVVNHRSASFVRAVQDVSTARTEALADLLVEGQALDQLRAFDANEVAHLILATKNGLLDRWSSDETLDLAVVSVTMLHFVEGAVSNR